MFRYEQHFNDCSASLTISSAILELGYKPGNPIVQKQMFQKLINFVQ